MFTAFSTVPPKHENYEINIVSTNCHQSCTNRNSKHVTHRYLFSKYYLTYKGKFDNTNSQHQHFR